MSHNPRGSVEIQTVFDSFQVEQNHKLRAYKEEEELLEKKRQTLHSAFKEANRIGDIEVSLIVFLFGCYLLM